MLKQLLDFLLKAPAKPDDSALKEFERTLAHAQRGYDTAQQTIKFLDTKVGIITGVSTALSGFLIAWGKWSLESKADSALNLFSSASQNKVYAACLAALFIGNFIATSLCIVAAIWTVIARAKPGGDVLVLFPSHPKAHAHIARETFARKLRGMSQADILHEYEKQLQTVGQILGEKLRAHRWACFFLLFQVSTVILAVAFVAGFSLLKEPSQNTQPKTTSIQMVITNAASMTTNTMATPPAP